MNTINWKLNQLEVELQAADDGSGLGQDISRRPCNCTRSARIGKPAVGYALQVLFIEQVVHVEAEHSVLEIAADVIPAVSKRQIDCRDGGNLFLIRQVAIDAAFVESPDIAVETSPTPTARI